MLEVAQIILFLIEFLNKFWSQFQIDNTDLAWGYNE